MYINRARDPCRPPDRFADAFGHSRYARRFRAVGRSTAVADGYSPNGYSHWVRDSRRMRNLYLEFAGRVSPIFNVTGGRRA